MELIIVTGLSGAGRKSVLASLEDLGITAMDNVPVGLLQPLLESEGKTRARIAVGMDSRHEDFAASFEPALHSLQDRSQPTHVFFLEASDDVLLRRYSETRRVHHLAGHGGSIPEAIGLERRLLAPIRALSTAILDTSSMSLTQMRQRIKELLPGLAEPGLQLRIVSFGYKFGVPLDADVVLDARFLPNPHYVPDLRPLTGMDQPVQDWLLSHEHFRAFLERALDWMRWSLPLIKAEGRAYHSVAIGCTGGQHRSVALAELLAQCLKDLAPDLVVRHREQN